MKPEKSNFADSWAGVRNSAHKNPQATGVPESEFLERKIFFGEILYFSEPYAAIIFVALVSKNVLRKIYKK